MNYEPAPNSGADRVLTFLRRMDADAPGCETISSIVSKEARVPADQLAVTMAPAIQAGACFVRQKGGAHNSPRFWSLVDRNAPVTKTAAASVFEWRGPAMRPEGAGLRVMAPETTKERRPKWVPRVAVDLDDALAQIRADKDSSTGEASSPADGSQTPDGAAAIPPAEAGSDIEGQASQQVLKAEAATPDATDRDAPANASPVGGPMGAGQAAAAAPLAKFALWSTGELAITVLDGDNALSRDGAYTLTLDAASTRALCHYLDRLREAS